MAKSFNTLLETMPSSRRQRVEEHFEELLLAMALQELRQKRHLTQQ